MTSSRDVKRKRLTSRLLALSIMGRMRHDSVSIRPYRHSDTRAVFDAARESIRDVYPFMPWCRPDLTQEEQREWLETQISAFRSGTAYEFAIVADGRYLGGCGVNQIDELNRRANVGYWVRSTATRRGVATTAIRALASWAFANTDLVRLEIVVAAENVASLRTAERAGANREGVLKNRLLLHDVFHDAVMFSLIRTDRNPKKARRVT
jgi:ribosomal-protein-serine acetyltransferase